MPLGKALALLRCGSRHVVAETRRARARGRESLDYTHATPRDTRFREPVALSEYSVTLAVFLVLLLIFFLLALLALGARLPLRLRLLALQRNERLERRQRAAVECSGKAGAAGVGDLGVAEVKRLELRQPSLRRRQRTCRRRRQEGGEALVAE
eukprot:scaffold95782_cov54-Phaeocystis_antarctica.AAC.1